MRNTIEHPKVFISYAWGSEDYKMKVRSFATDLMNDGIEVVLDQWSLKEGNDTYAFMEQSVTDSTITNVLILLDPVYEKKPMEEMAGWERKHKSFHQRFIVELNKKNFCQ